MKIIVSIAIICFSFMMDAKGQNKDQLENAIRTSLNFLVKEYNRFREKGILTEELFFSIDNYPPYFKLEDTIQGIPVRYISLNNRSVSKKYLKKSATVIYLRNLELNGNKLSIAFNSASVKIKRNVLHLGLKDPASFVYEYSCEKQEWILIETKFYKN